LALEDILELTDELRARTAVRAGRDELDDAGGNHHLSLSFDQAVEAIDDILVADPSLRSPGQVHEHRLEELNRAVRRRHADAHGLRRLLEKAAVTRAARRPDERRHGVLAGPNGAGPGPEVERLAGLALDLIGVWIEYGHAALRLLTT